MSDKAENPPAFPRDHRNDWHNGLTMRDWFAGQAIALAHPADGPTNMAEFAYAVADAMLQEGAKG